MNAALDKLYNELLQQADNEPATQLTEAERAKRFLAEKQITIDKLKEVAIQKRIDQGKREKEIIRNIEESTMRFWKRDITGKRKETGVLYFGESTRRGGAWVPHGHGEYRAHGEIIYEGQFSHGEMHGTGRLLMGNGDIWAGQFWRDRMHGMGTIVGEDNSKRKAIYWQDKRVCFVDELVPGCRLQLLSDEFVRDADGAASIVAATHRDGRYRLRLDNGKEKLLRLDNERFRLLRHKPRVITLDTILGPTTYGQLYDYDHDQANPQTSAHRENYYYPDLWAGREKAKQEEQAKLDLEMKRLQTIARRQVERDEQAAANRAADVARGLEEEMLRRKEVEGMAAEAGRKGKEALEAAQGAAAVKKQKQKDLSRSPPRDRGSH